MKIQIVEHTYWEYEIDPKNEDDFDPFDDATYISKTEVENNALDGWNYI